MAVKSRPRGNVVQLARPTLRETIGRLAPGTALRDGLERILRGRTGALIVLGYDDSVEAICDGGFSLDVRYAPTRLRELSKMDGAVVLSSDGSTILRANVQLVPDPSIPTDESGTRHRSAERTAVQTGYPVISVSHSMSIVTVYVAGERHVVPDSATILSRANQTIDTLERYKSRLDEVSRQLSTAEIEDFVTLRDVMTVVQRLEMVRRISLEIDSDVVELGTDGRQLKLQLEELVGDNDAARELIVRDYHANPDPPRAAQVSATLEELDAAIGHRAARLHHAGKGFRLPVDCGGPGLGDELTRIPCNGGHSASAVRPRRPAGSLVRVASGPAGRKRQRSAVGRGHRVDVGAPHPRGFVAAGGVDDRRPAGLAGRAPGSWSGTGAPSAGAGASASGAGWARMNGTAADLRLPSWTSRLYVPGPIGWRGSGHPGPEPIPVQVTSVVTCSPGLNVLTSVSFDGAQSRFDHSRVLSSP